MKLFFCLMIALLLFGLVCALWPFMRRSAKQWGYVISIVLLFPIVSLSLYYYWGSGVKLYQLNQQQQQIAAVRQQLANYKNVDDLTDGLKQRLQQQPNSAKGWYLLGRLYYTSQRYSQAINAYEKSNRLKPNDPKIILQLVLARYANNKHLSPKDKTLLNQVLQKNKNNPLALQLLTSDASKVKGY